MVRPGSFKPHEAIVRLHIKPTLGKTKLERLPALQLQTLYHTKLEEGLSPRRVQYIHVTLHKALKDAVRWELVRSNVADSVKPPSLGFAAVHRRSKPLQIDTLGVMLIPTLQHV